MITDWLIDTIERVRIGAGRMEGALWLFLIVFITGWVTPYLLTAAVVAYCIMLQFGPWVNYAAQRRVEEGSFNNLFDKNKPENLYP